MSGVPLGKLERRLEKGVDARADLPEQNGADCGLEGSDRGPQGSGPHCGLPFPPRDLGGLVCDVVLPPLLRGQVSPVSGGFGAASPAGDPCARRKVRPPPEQPEREDDEEHYVGRPGDVAKEVAAGRGVVRDLGREGVCCRCRSFGSRRRERREEKAEHGRPGRRR